MVVGQPTVTKPSRSDEVLDEDQQIMITEQVRAQFDSLAPKRPAKPNRSESDSTTPPTSYAPDSDIPVPELDKLKSLQSQSHTILSGSVLEVQEEFVETEYYKKLDSIDKQHHTTGSGFIKVAAGNDDYDLKLAGGNQALQNKEMVFKTNPATNDWIPSLETDQDAFVSSKPNRSESS
ncbi:OLC1v1010237C2 [Oldenlandia corymbosa var. corymbosa]|uniref:OLC1v1010237C2 n=1 Tax=Oldenlandia corymbosa var. corymbosa TaxID=529605 RepID=A0AAV1DR43_OLDCO|nr:OLC1v1010237C2 [Oldenlandia corymbosa var. corymbosa]